MTEPGCRDNRRCDSERTRFLDHALDVARRHHHDDEVGNFRELAERFEAGLPLDAAMAWIDRIERALETARNQVAQKGTAE